MMEKEKEIKDKKKIYTWWLSTVNGPSPPSGNNIITELGQIIITESGQNIITE